MKLFNRVRNKLDKVSDLQDFFSILCNVAGRFCLKWHEHVMGKLWKAELYLRGVRVSSFRRLQVIGRPIVNLGIGSKITIGNRVVLVSSSRYCLPCSLYSSCKLQTMCASAEINIGDQSTFSGTSIVCRSSKITIGSRTMVGPNVTIMDSPYHPIWPTSERNSYSGNELDRAVEIGDDVWIAGQVVILPGTKIGSGSVIGAGSVVKGEIPPDCLAVGSPAKVVRWLGDKTSGFDVKQKVAIAVQDSAC